ncbi:MAG: hypothetical protein JWR19_4233 [Pedosphaera sp.]|nr:hypothetical protein [Pedosphaera sp.]
MSKHIPFLPLALGAAIGFCAHAFFFSKEPAAAQINLGNNATVVQGNFKTRSSGVQTQAAGNQMQAAAEDLAKIKMALKHLNDIADLNERTAARNTLLRRWANLDGQGALQSVSEMDEGEAKVQAMSAVAGVLVNSEPHLLAQQASALSGSRSSRELIQNLANSWAQSDIQSALTWANQLPDGIGKKDALAIIRFQLAKQNPEQTSAEISQLPAGDARNSLISNLAAQWGLSNPQSAIDWANTLPENEKKLAMSNLVGAWAQNDPSAAGTYAAQMPSGEAQSQATMSVVSSWANKNPDQTAAWVLQFPEGDLREQGIREVVGIWTLSDSKSVQNWAEGLPESSTRDIALKSYVDSIGYWSPDKAAAVTGLIDDSQKREQSMEATTRFWAEIDPKSAQNWVARLNVSEEFRTRLQSLLSTD